MKKIIISFSLLLPCVTMAQNVGIGTNTPAELLDVNGNARAINNQHLGGGIIFASPCYGFIAAELFKQRKCAAGYVYVLLRNSEML